MTIKIWDGKSYHITSAQINADKEGCEVFEISGQMGQLRVLAHDRQEAVEAYREEMYGDPDYCEECGGYGVENCDCDESTSEEDSQDGTAAPEAQSGPPAPEPPDSKGPELAGV